MIRFSAQDANLPFGTLRKGAKWRGGACSGRLVGTRSLGGGGWGRRLLRALTGGAYFSLEHLHLNVLQFNITFR